jgi:hypothetical protein
VPSSSAAPTHHRKVRTVRVRVRAWLWRAEDNRMQIFFVCMGFNRHSLHTRPGDCAVILPTAPSCVRAVSIWCRRRRGSIDAGSWSYEPWETGLAILISDWPGPLP